MASVSFRNLHKSYGETVVLRNINIDVEDGEFLVLVGPSGCGKSTLLRCLAGLQETSSGDIFIGDELVTNLAPRDRDVAMVFQSYALYPHMTVRQNMGFALKMSKRPIAEIEAAVLDAANMLDLKPLLERYPKELSGGQRQRVAMGRAIVRRPKVFLFDEPLSNLDAKLRNQLRLELKRLHKQLKTTMIYVTHDQVEAMTLADRIAVLNGEGIKEETSDTNLQQLGTPDELFYEPVNKFVAGFIGSPAMRFLYNLPGKKDVVVGVRPNDVILGSGEFTGEIEAVERLGFESHVHIRYKGEPITARTEGEPPKLGPIKFHFAKEYIFDPLTGKRL
jgi:multiple sugar transport system ATP-binding protein